MGEGERFRVSPMVSVVMPVYNSQEFLEKSVGTILGQTFPDFQLILVDDGSKDESLKMLQEFQKMDPRVQVISQKNQGAGVARNTGMAVASGKYIHFLDSDDYFEEHMLELMVKKAEETGADVTICRATCFDHQTGKALPSDWLRKDKFLDRLEGRTVFSPEEMGDCLFQFTYGWAWDKLFRLEFVRESGLTFSEMPSSNDFFFVYGMLSRCDRMAVVSDSLVHYRMERKASISGGNTFREYGEEVFREVDKLVLDLKEQQRYLVYERTTVLFSVEYQIWHLCHGDKVRREEYLTVRKRLGAVSWLEVGGSGGSVLLWKFFLLKYGTYSLLSLVLSIHKLIKERRSVRCGKNGKTF